MSEVILDSGNRRDFGTGAVRDVADGKGRCDLLPLDVVSQIIGDPIFTSIDLYVRGGDTGDLVGAIALFLQAQGTDEPTAMLEVSQHYEAGCQKYGDRNWEKGIPCHCYIDSGVRHYLKHLRGDTDEAHDRAFIWNLMCCIYTHNHLPKMIDLPFKGKTQSTPARDKCIFCGVELSDSYVCLDCARKDISPAPTEPVPQIPQDEPIFVEAACGNCRHTRPINGTRYVCLRMGSCRNEVEKSEKPCKYWEANP